MNLFEQADKSLDFIETDFLYAVKKERIRQYRLHGDDSDLSLERLYLILAEEVGEVAKAIQEGDLGEVQAETVQVAAVCAKILEFTGFTGKAD